ncbi:MAG: hypothetical protein BWK76_21010 [Desulfobulbaceae bacterium A2]|nr:MAG: hypothetical protein BWK76_21010 [Desulfobulbaceae bacterium A2]
MLRRRPWRGLPALALCVLCLCVVPAVVTAEVQVELPDGHDEQLQRQISSHLSLGRLRCDAQADTVQRRYRRLAADAGEALSALGYYRPAFATDLVWEEHCWQARLIVHPGEQVRLRRVELLVEGEASSDPAFDRLRAALPLVPGDPLHHGKYEDLKITVQDLALERGYFQGRFLRRQLLVDPEAGWADIELVFDSGPRALFGPVRPRGESPLAPEVLARFHQLKSDSPYDGESLLAANRALSDSGYFSFVNLSPRRDEIEDLRVPLDLELRPKNRHAWRTGLGVETDIGPRMSLGYENRFLNSAGHRLNADLRLSGPQSEFGAVYTLPGDDPREEQYNLSLGLKHEDIDNTLSDLVKGSVRYSFRYGPWQVTPLVDLLREFSRVDNEDADGSFVMPGLHLSRTEADDPKMVRRGYRFSAEVKGGDKLLLSSASLLQARTSAKGVYRFGEGGRLIGRGEAGVSLTDEFVDLPLSLRFFAGGDNSVRGYGYKRLGPRTAQGSVRGGKNLLVGSMEYEHPLNEEWWVAIFYDTGDAFDGEKIALESGYGGGLRWHLGFVSLRLDLAIPSDPSAGSYRIHFTMGTDL